MSFESQRRTVGLEVVLTPGEPFTFEREVALKAAFEDMDISQLAVQRLAANVSEPGLVYFQHVLVGDAEIIMPGDEIDAWLWNPNAVGVHVGSPEVGPEATIKMVGRYTGVIARFMTRGTPFAFTLVATGPAVPW